MPFLTSPKSSRTGRAPTRDPAVIEILYRDDALIAVNKPANLAVHRSKFVGPADDFMIDLLREQVGDNVYLAHRLDRATSGVLLVARNKEVAAA